MNVPLLNKMHFICYILFRQSLLDNIKYPITLRHTLHSYEQNKHAVFLILIRFLNQYLLGMLSFFTKALMSQNPQLLLEDPSIPRGLSLNRLIGCLPALSRTDGDTRLLTDRHCSWYFHESYSCPVHLKLIYWCHPFKSIISFSTQTFSLKKNQHAIHKYIHEHSFEFWMVHALRNFQ